MSNKIKLHTVRWSTNESGPSPDNNYRTELYFSGCKKAKEGNPCQECFNSSLWEEYEGQGRSPEDIAEHLDKYAPHKYITIVGGEPTDQLEGLTQLCFLLKQKGFHIILFSWKELREENAFSIVPFWRELIKHIDILVDGEYDKSQHMFDETCVDGFHNVIGSKNQIIWDIQEANKKNKKIIKGHKAEDIKMLYVDSDHNLKYLLADFCLKTESAYTV